MRIGDMQNTSITRFRHFVPIFLTKQAGLLAYPVPIKPAAEPAPKTLMNSLRVKAMISYPQWMIQN